MMMIIYFLNGLSFGGLGLAAYLQMRQGGDFPIKKQLPWLAAFGFVCGATHWLNMFLVSDANSELYPILIILRMLLQPLTGLLLLKFGWGIFRQLPPLPAWTNFIPGVLIVPIAYLVTYAASTFITPSPLEIPIDIWSRYLLYLPGSIIAGIGFLGLSYMQRKEGYQDVSNLMLGAGLAFLVEAFVVGLIVPAAPYGPASYYNYDRVVHNAFIGEASSSIAFSGFTSWLDYQHVLEATHLPIQFWRMLSAFAVTFFVVRSLGVFDAIRKRQLLELQQERDRAQKAAFEAQFTARQAAERWTDALVRINRQITELKDVDGILLNIIQTARALLHSDFIAFALLNEEHTQLLMKCVSHQRTSEMLDPPLLVDNPLVINTVRANRSYRSINDDTEEITPFMCPFLDKPARAIAVVPIELDYQPIGALWISRCQDGSALFTQTDLIWLECMADQIVIAIQHGLMTSQLQSLSIVEERARIAREMHDGLAQVLGYLNLQVQALEALEKQGKQEALREEMSQMRQAIRAAHADVRESILSLRTTLASEKGLITSIDEYLDEFTIQTGIASSFNNAVKEKVNLASIAEVQLVCILQEALANVRKHSHASNVDVSITKDTYDEIEYINLEIRDNGVGFEMQSSKRSFGLQTMRERANSVKGSLEAMSTVGKGTTITCRLPCLEQEQLAKRSVVLS